MNLSITIIFFAFFANLTLQQTDTLKQDLTSYVLQQSNIPEEDLILVKELCKVNPEQEGCEILNQNPLDNFVNQINALKDYFILALLVIIALFVLGFVFVFLGTGDLLQTSYNVSLNITILSYFSAFYYRILPDLIKSILNQDFFKNLLQGVDPSIINDILKIIFNWILRPLIRTFNLALIVGTIFLLVTIALFVIKKRKGKPLKQDKIAKKT